MCRTQETIEAEKKAEAAKIGADENIKDPKKAGEATTVEAKAKVDAKAEKNTGVVKSQDEVTKDN